MSFAADNDPLELILVSRVKGAKEANAAAAAAANMATAENKAATSAKVGIGVYERLAAVRKELAKVNAGEVQATSDRVKDLESAVSRYERAIGRMNAAGQPKQGPERGPRAAVYGNYGRLARVNSLLSGGGLTNGQEADLREQQSAIQARIDKQEKAPKTQGQKIMTAILSSRFGLGGGGTGGIQPLVGRTLAAFGVEGAAAGPVGLAIAAVAAVVKVAQEMVALGDEASKLTQRFTDLHAQIGGSGTSTGQAAILSRITGVDAGAAATAFQSRITSDPVAMGFAGRLGIRNIAAPFGSVDFGSQYQSAIERTSAIRNADERRRMSLTLGISQEVERYRLLSPETRQSLKSEGAFSAQINDPVSQKRAAEFEAAQERLSAASDHFRTALGGGFARNFTIFLNGLADSLDISADIMDRLNKSPLGISPMALLAQKLKEHNIPLSPVAAIGQMFGLGANGAGPAVAAQTAHTAATMENNRLLGENNQNLYRLNGTLGGGDRAGSAVPSGLRGANLSRAVTDKGLALGGL